MKTKELHKYKEGDYQIIGQNSTGYHLEMWCGGYYGDRFGWYSFERDEGDRKMYKSAESAERGFNKYVKLQQVYNKDTSSWRLVNGKKKTERRT